MESTTSPSPHCTLITKMDNGNVRLDHHAFSSYLERMQIGEKPICVISISGQARRGKSFLMNLIRRYIASSGWKNDWLGKEDEKYQIDQFHAAPGKKQVTLGILLYNEVYEVKWKEKTMVIILMDTQGLFNATNAPSVDKFMLTLTTLMSSVQLFNVRSEVNTNELNYLNAAVDYSKRSMASDDNDHHMKLQDFVMIVRDAVEDDDEQYLDELLDGKSMAPEYEKMIANLKSSFTDIKLYMLPGPGTKVVRGRYKDAISKKDIDSEFLDGINRFLTEVVNPRRSLEPKHWNGGKLLTSNDLLKIMASCDNLFSNNADIDTSTAPSKIMEANQRVFYENNFEDAFKQFSQEIENISTEDIYEMEGECKKAARRAMTKYVRATANLVGEEGKQHYESYKRRLLGQTDNIIQSKLRMLEMKNKMKSGEKEEEIQRKFKEYVKKMNLLVDVDGTNVEQQHKAISSEIMQQGGGAGHSKLIGLMENDLRVRRSILQRRKRDNEARRAVQTDQRRKSISRQLQIQRQSLDELWKEKLNDLANGKRKQVGPVMSAKELPWQDFKLLSLSHQEVAQVAPNIESESRRKYWEMNLNDIEKHFNCELNRKLRDIFSTYHSPPRGVFRQEFEILPEARSGRFKLTTTTAYEKMLGKLVQEFEDDLEKHENSNKGVGSYSLHVRKVIDLHEKFLRWCSPELFVQLQQLVTELNDKKEEFLQLRKNEMERKQVGILLSIDVIIQAIEESMKEEMATKHLHPQHLHELYSVIKSKHMDPVRTGGMMGFQPSKELQEFFEKAVNAKMEQSLARILEENERNKAFVLLRYMKVLLDDSKEGGKKEKKGFFRRIFGKKDS